MNPANDNDVEHPFNGLHELMRQVDQALAISRDLREGSRRLVKELSTPREDDNV